MFLVRLLVSLFVAGMLIQHSIARSPACMVLCSSKQGTADDTDMHARVCSFRSETHILSRGFGDSLAGGRL